MSAITNPTDIIQRLRALSKEMQTLGAAMSYYGGFNPVMAKRGGELFEDGQVIAGWAGDMMADQE